MTQTELKSMGFSKVQVSALESGADPFFYYRYELTDGIGFISPANDEIKSGRWYVEFYDTDPVVRFRKATELQTVIDIIEKSIVKEEIF